MWSGGIVGIKKILGVRSREKALAVLDALKDMEYISYTLEETKKLPSGTVSGHQVICYPEQLAFVQEFFGDLAEYATVTMDAVENALELNSLSLIE